MKNNDWKNRLNVVYSTNPDYLYDTPKEEKIEMLPKEKQNLRVTLDKKNRNGKTVTIVSGYIGAKNDLKELSKFLKTKCGVGGSVKETDIIIQGDFKVKITELLKEEGYSKIKMIG